MRSSIIAAVIPASFGIANAQGAPGIDNCLSPGDMREIVSTNRVVAPVVAIRAARQAVPKADVVRARLCQHAEAFIYVIVALRRDGRVAHVTIDASSGKVRSIH